MTNSTQKKIGKVRPPRVQITYDVEVGDAVKQKTLPFVVGVLADLSPGGTVSEMRVRDRSFVEIDKDNFDKVMTALNPRIAFSVPNRLGGENQKLCVDLSFPKFESFSPAQVAQAVPQLAELLETRARLNDLLAKLEGNEKLNDLLAEVVLNTEVQVQACSELTRREQAQTEDAAGESAPQ